MYSQQNSLRSSDMAGLNTHGSKANVNGVVVVVVVVIVVVVVVVVDVVDVVVVVVVVVSNAAVCLFSDFGWPMV